MLCVVTLHWRTDTTPYVHISFLYSYIYILQYKYIYISLETIWLVLTTLWLNITQVSSDFIDALYSLPELHCYINIEIVPMNDISFADFTQFCVWNLALALYALLYRLHIYIYIVFYCITKFNNIIIYRRLFQERIVFNKWDIYVFVCVHVQVDYNNVLYFQRLLDQWWIQKSQMLQMNN